MYYLLKMSSTFKRSKVIFLRIKMSDADRAVKSKFFNSFADVSTR